MSKLLPFVTGLAIMSTSVTALADDVLTGDTRLACEAVLCLSTGNRPNECAPSIQRYFSINHKNIADTIKGRRNFLNLCPSSKDKGMSALIDALANGAGRCDATELNRINRQVLTLPNPVFERGGRCAHSWSQDKGSCIFEPKTITKTIINNKKPAYCEAYFSHGWTQIGTRYQGTPMDDGKWVD